VNKLFFLRGGSVSLWASLYDHQIFSKSTFFFWRDARNPFIRLFCFFLLFDFVFFFYLRDNYREFRAAIGNDSNQFLFIFFFLKGRNRMDSRREKK
jgi:hypothetical protein